MQPTYQIFERSVKGFEMTDRSGMEQNFPSHEFQFGAVSKLFNQNIIQEITKLKVE